MSAVPWWESWPCIRPPITRLTGLTGRALVQRKDQEAEPLYRCAMKIAKAMDVEDDLQRSTRLSDLASLQAKQVGAKTGSFGGGKGRLCL